MQCVRAAVRPLLLFACAALLAISGCAAPVAFHDGLPAWSPPAGRPEVSVGYHGMFWPPAGLAFGYLTPGFRVGLAQPPLAVDVGLNWVVAVGGVWPVILGPGLGLGYQDQNMSFVVRPSAYMQFAGEGNERFGFDFPFWQVAVLAGNGHQPGKPHVSGGFRIGRLGVGPVVLFGHEFVPVGLRLEWSYMFAYNDDAEGRLLTAGLTLAAPAPLAE